LTSAIVEGHASQCCRRQEQAAGTDQGRGGWEAVTICRRGVPVVDIVRTQEPTRKKPKFGTLKGKIKIIDPDWWKPLTDEEVDDFLEGRY
jgi:hypothetical protein